MRFMMLVKCTLQSEAGGMPSQALMDAMAVDGAELRRTGVMIADGGLAPTSQGTRIQVSAGKLSMVDGPFAETTELVGGFAIMEVRDRDEALELGRRFMKTHLEHMGPEYEGQLEIRQIFNH